VKIEQGLIILKIDRLQQIADIPEVDIRTVFVKHRDCLL